MPVPILLYHHISEPPSKGTPSRSNYVRPENFARQMRWLSRLGFQGLSLAEAMPYISGKKNGKVAAITFDDGFLSVFEHAMPVLAKYGFTATNFFVADQLGRQNDWDAPQAIREPCMTIDQMLQWVNAGHEAGSHTLTHVHLTDIGQNEAKREIVLSKQKLEDMLGREIFSFAYPYGDENDEIRALVKSAGYRYGATTRRGRALPVHDMFELPRHSVRRNDLAPHFLAKCLLR